VRATTDTDRGGLDHIGHVYDLATGLVPGVLPAVRAALDAGMEVSAIVGRGEEQAMRAALGPHAPITFPPPEDVQAPGRGFVDHLREVGAAAPGLVVAQYSVFEIPDGELRQGEDDINDVLSDLPVTVVCACSTAERSTRQATARAAHPRMLRGGVASDNEIYRRPGLSLEVRAGVHALGLTFRARADLPYIREHVAAVARAAGLSREDGQACVMAVHEAALIVTGDHVPSFDVGSEPCELDLWAADGAVTAELRGPVPPGAPDVPDVPRIPRDDRRRPDPLDYVRLFCQDAERVETAGTRVVRLLATRRPVRQPGWTDTLGPDGARGVGR
jgi:hypothetical protein